MQKLAHAGTDGDHQRARHADEALRGDAAAQLGDDAGETHARGGGQGPGHAMGIDRRKVLRCGEGVSYSDGFCVYG